MAPSRISISLNKMQLATAIATLFAAVVPGAPIDYLNPNQDVSDSLQNILANTHGSAAYTYPTDLTRNIMPVCFSLSICCSGITDCFHRKLSTRIMTTGVIFHSTQLSQQV